MPPPAPAFRPVSPRSRRQPVECRQHCTTSTSSAIATRILRLDERSSVLMGERTRPDLLPLTIPWSPKRKQGRIRLRGGCDRQPGRPQAHECSHARSPWTCCWSTPVRVTRTAWLIRMETRSDQRRHRPPVAPPGRLLPLAEAVAQRSRVGGCGRWWWVGPCRRVRLEGRCDCVGPCFRPLWRRVGGGRPCRGCGSSSVIATRCAP